MEEVLYFVVYVHLFFCDIFYIFYFFLLISFLFLFLISFTFSYSVFFSSFFLFLSYYLPFTFFFSLWFDRFSTFSFTAGLRNETKLNRISPVHTPFLSSISISPPPCQNICHSSFLAPFTFPCSECLTYVAPFSSAVFYSPTSFNS